MSKSSKTIALVMMVKNEHLRIKVSLESVKDFVDSFIILDTGSTDNTISIIKKYASEYNKKLYLIEQTFPQPFDFSKARNAVLDYADDKADFLLLLDCNDELQNATFDTMDSETNKIVKKQIIREFVNTYNGTSEAFNVCQEWWNGNSIDKYYNIRFVKSKCGWRYNGAIHEYIMAPHAENKKGFVSIVPNIKLYQDRTKDDDKSEKRFVKDRDIFHSEYVNTLERMKTDPSIKMDPRTIFYYAQTCQCLHDIENSYKLYRERVKMDGFLEEKFHAFYRCGKESMRLKHDWEESLVWFLRAYEFSSKLFVNPRAEPILNVSEFYFNKQEYEMCWMFLKRCCELPYPTDAVLFVDRRVYDYSRWSLMGQLGSNLKSVEQQEYGKKACFTSIEFQKENKNDDIESMDDFKNLMKYFKGNTDKRKKDSFEYLNREKETTQLELQKQQKKAEMKNMESLLFQPVQTQRKITKEEQTKISLQKKLQDKKNKK